MGGLEPATPGTRTLKATIGPSGPRIASRIGQSSNLIIDHVESNHFFDSRGMLGRAIKDNTRDLLSAPSSPPLSKVLS